MQIESLDVACNLKGDYPTYDTKRHDPISRKTSGWLYTQK